MRKKTSFRDFDRLLFFAPIAIFFIGVCSIYSASFNTGQPLDQGLAMKQLTWMGLGTLVVFLIIRFDYYALQDLAWPLYCVSLFFLVIVLLMPARLGAHRWIPVGSFNFQPSELAKFSLILVLAKFFAHNRHEFVSTEKKLFPLAVTLPPFLLILKEPDLGTGMLLLPILFAMLYLWGTKGRKILLIFLLGALACPVLFHFLKDYQKSRILVFLNPNLDPLGAGYTIIQSKIAIGSGGFFGQGFMSGSQNKLDFVPERHTDFIFAVISEEGGLFLAFIVLLLFALIVKRGYRIARQTPDRFGSYLACGISTMIGIQAMINIAMTMGLVPVVGIPLPLVSYGGTSALINMALIAILINIKMHRPLF